MQNQFIVSHNGVEMTPQTAEEILTQLSKGELDPIDYVYIEAKQDWMMLDEFKLFWEKQKPKSATSEAPPTLSPYPSINDKANVLFVEPTKNENKAKVTPLLKENSKVETSTPKNSEIPAVPKVTYTPAATPEVKITAKQKEVSHVPQAISRSEPANVTSSESATPFLTTAKQITNPKSITVKQGTGMASLSALKTGEIAIELRSKLKLNTSGTLKISIRSGEPGKMMCSGPSKSVVGENAIFEFHVQDDYGNKVSQFAESFQVKWQGEHQGPSTLNFVDGVGQLQFTTTKTQKVSFAIQTSGQHPRLSVPETQNINFVAGPAAQLVLEGPDEAMAGEAIQVRIKAVDKYGNLAELDEDVEVEIKTPTAG